MARVRLPSGVAAEAPEPDQLNLGSGEDYREDAWNVDYNKRYDPDSVVDLNEDWPAEWALSFDYVLASHVFEHLDDLDHAFAEAARCLRPGGVLEVRVPFGINAETDRTHQHEHWTWDSGLQYAKNWRGYNDAYQFDVTHPFVMIDREVSYLVGHGPGQYLKPFVQWYWKRSEGVWISTTPFTSGEFTFTYRRAEP